MNNHVKPHRITKKTTSSDSNAGWINQLQNRICSLEDLQRHLPGVQYTEAMQQAEHTFPMAITPYYASLIRHPNASDPVFRQCVPNASELQTSAWLSADPLGEVSCSPIPELIHRYPDRALILITSACAVYCRHCTRKRVSAQSDTVLSQKNLDACIAYLTKNPKISDVLLSGGDPLLLSDSQIDTLLTHVRSVKSVKVIRMATRTLVTLPMRVTPALITVLKHHAPIFVNTHFNHPVELTEIAVKAANLLTDAGIPVGNQTVLLRGVNDTPAIIETLCRTLYHNRIRPYYLFQCDLVGGIEHFRTPLQTGIAIMKHLRGRLSGLAIPHFVVDTPEHGGKVELLPNAIHGKTPAGTRLENNQGEIFLYPEPHVPDA